MTDVKGIRLDQENNLIRMWRFEYYIETVLSVELYDQIFCQMKLYISLKFLKGSKVLEYIIVVNVKFEK